MSNQQQVNNNMVWKLVGIIISVLVLCSGWIFGILKEANASTSQICIEKTEDNKNSISELRKIVLNHEKILPVIMAELANIKDFMKQLSGR
jgi:hypothetical protein